MCIYIYIYYLDSNFFGTKSALFTYLNPYGEGTAGSREITCQVSVLSLLMSGVLNKMLLVETRRRKRVSRRERAPLEVFQNGPGGWWIFSAEPPGSTRHAIVKAVKHVYRGATQFFSVRNLMEKQKVPVRAHETQITPKSVGAGLLTLEPQNEVRKEGPPSQTRKILEP